MDGVGARRWTAEVYRVQRERVRWKVQRHGVPARNVDDVVQDVFVAVLQGARRYDARRPLRPWLDAITYRTARDYMRLRRSRELLVAEDLDRADPSALPDERCAGAERLRRVFTLWALTARPDRKI